MAKMARGTYLFLPLLLVLGACAVSEPLLAPSQPFRSDGCTLAPDFNFSTCCFRHDRDYWCGGTKAQRVEADRALRACIQSAGHPWLDFWYYWGTRLGGVAWLPTPWRWGFGWPWGQGTTTEARSCEAAVDGTTPSNAAFH